MTEISLDSARGSSLRVCGLGGAGFTLLYVVHRLLQGLGPAGSSPAAVTAYTVERRGALLASEAAVGLALLAFIAFLAPLVVVLWRAGQETFAVATLTAGTVFLAMGFMSLAAETALVGAARAGDPAAVLALDHLQGRTPIVWTIAGLATIVSLALLRTALVPRWLAVAGLVAAAVFLLGSVASVLGPTPEGRSSVFGIGVFVVWMLALSAALWRAGLPGRAVDPA